MTTAAVITKYDEAVTNEPPSPPTQDTFARETSSENPPTYNDGTSDDRPAKLTLGQRFHKISSKVGQPLNKAANGIGAEGWWPDRLENESVKAARILYSFTSKSPTSHF